MPESHLIVNELRICSRSSPMILPCSARARICVIGEVCLCCGAQADSRVHHAHHTASRSTRLSSVPASRDPLARLTDCSV